MALAAVLALASGCGAGPAEISLAWMSADEAGEQPVTSYPPDAPFYAQVQLENAPDGTMLKTSWIAVDAEGTPPGGVIHDSETPARSGRVLFTMTNDDLWGVGTYKVDIYLDGELNRSLEFSVQ